MALSAKVDQMLAAMLEQSLGIGVRVFDAPEARRIQRENLTPAEPPPVAKVAERIVPGPPGAPPVRIRIFYPLGRHTQPPLLTFFHGGGWVMCSLDTHDAMCRRLANGSQSIVISVDYRLAPEAPFPAAIEDAFAVVTWLQAYGAELGGDPTRIGVAGDSAGGNLAAVVPLMLRDRGKAQIGLQVLIYPVIDGSLSTASYAQFADGGGYVTRAEMAWFWGQYVEDRKRAHPYASPILADLTGLPTAMVVVAECDPLRDEGRGYAERLGEAGVPVHFVQYNGVFHDFFGLVPLLRKSGQASTEVNRWIRTTFRDMAVQGRTRRIRGRRQA